MATPSDQAYKHIIPLDFNSVKSVPDSFVWLESDVIPSSDGLSIPVINLMDPNAPKLIIQACETWGIFHLKGHGIPTELMEDVESEARKLFDLPIDQKLKAIRSPDGQTGYGTAPIQSLFSTFMWHEGFCILGSAIDQAKLLWLHDYQGFWYVPCTSTTKIFTGQITLLISVVWIIFYFRLIIFISEIFK